MDWTIWCIIFRRWTVTTEYTNVETKEKATQIKIHPLFSFILCEQQRKGEELKGADTYTESMWLWLRDVSYFSLYIYQNRIWRSVRLKTYMENPISLRTHTSSSFTAKTKHFLMHKFTKISASGLNNRFYCLHVPSLHAVILHCPTKLARMAQVIRVWADQLGRGGRVEDPLCNKIRNSEPTQFGKSRESRRVIKPSREHLGIFGTVIDDSDWLTSFKGFWCSILIGYREEFGFGLYLGFFLNVIG